MMGHDHFRDQEDNLSNGNNEGLGFAELFEEEEDGEREGLGLDELFARLEDGESNELGSVEFTESVPSITMDIEEDSENVVEEENENPEDYLRQALINQGLDSVPRGLKETWEDGDYEYEVRIHEGNEEYTEAEFIYRVARRRTVVDEHGQGEGREYLGTDGSWRRERNLRETYRNGNPNPNFNEEAARATHIPLNRDININRNPEEDREEEDRTEEEEEKQNE